VKTVPLDLREAVSYAEKDPFIQETLGEDFAKVYSESKYREWSDFMKEVTPWEESSYLYKL